MTMLKKVFASLLALVMLLTLSAAVAEDNSLQAVLDKGTFIIGLDDSFPPLGYRDENNDIVGFDIDVARAVAEKLNLSPSPSAGKPRNWSFPPAISTASGTACPSRPNGRKAWP